MARGLRILHVVTDLRIGGTQKILLERVREPGGLHHEVLVFAAHTGVSSGPDLTAAFASAGTRVHTLGITRPRALARAWFDGSLARRLDRIVEEARPDLLHSTLFHSHLLADRIARRRIPHLASKEGIDTWMNPLVRGAEARALRRAGRVACVSEAARRVVLRAGVPEARTRVIPGGIDPAHPGSWRIPEVEDPGTPRLLGVGRLDRAKGWEDLLRALALLLPGLPEAKLDLVGWGPEEPRLRALARRLGVASAVRFHIGADGAGNRAAQGCASGGTTPREPDPAREPAPIFVVPSREEGFGLILLEGMARGLPIVASRVGGIPEVVREGTDALLVPPRDPSALAGAIARLASDAALADRLTRAGREQAARFPLAAMVARYHSLYREMLDGAGEART